ncbi:uncharacterized protein LOC118344500 isoform X2 [Juglans regia]|uniref:Uncharacterized protein LOC118344500 isoform X1 n=1 Tax=Juglans regia TaxID=51240 RepID=A0A6P9E1F0_JUGRE|nr:uncharacterized protein LOC118344500 isoform X1 [Juglans regia]XP_035541168.1 uncharacterized protein LOC118344500 isoform X2 [Juglans regia]
MWDNRVVKMVEDCIGVFLVACVLRNLEDGWTWALASVYGPNRDPDRYLLWDEVSGFYSLWELPWCICGDFNIICFPSEREGLSSMTTAMEDFSQLIFDLELLDLPLVGGEYTWSNSRGGSRLDRFLVSSSWEAHYPKSCQKRLSRVCCNHFPILLDCGGIHESKRYFKFKNMWLEVEGFVDKIRSWWLSYHFEGTPSFVLASKLKALKVDLKKWNKEVFGNVEQQKKSLWDELQSLEAEGESEVTSSRKTEVMAEIERVLLREEISWRQKSRVLWLKDKCTSFFHKMTNSHRRNNAIEMFKTENNLLSTPDEIQEHVVQFYSPLLSETEA